MAICRVSFLLMVLIAFGLLGCTKNSTTILKEPLLGMEFVHIPKGTFQMGDLEIAGTSYLKSTRKVHISKGFWLGKTEVTQRQWSEVMGTNEIHPEKPSPFRNEHPDYPIVSVSYYDIEKFLDRLNELSNGYQFRLPTEAEWEYACRATTTTPFHYGSKLSDTLANYNSQIASEYSTLGIYPGHPKPVGKYPPNKWGLYDMHGNVWEWVSDWYAPLSTEIVRDPKGPLHGNEKVIRGGSWYFGAENAKSAYRRTHDPRLWGFSIGFRLVCEKRTSL